MDQNVFFKWVWRFNALALALVLLAAAAALAIPFLSWRVAPAIEAAIDPTPPTPEPSIYQWTLQPPRDERSEGMLALEIPAPYERGGSFSSGPSINKVVNYLFVDTNTGATRWLFPTHKQVITATDYVTETMSPMPGVPAQGPASAIVFDVAPGDPAAFSFGKPAKYEVYASKPDGTGLTKLLGDLDEAPIFVPVGKDKILIRAQSNGKQTAASFSLTDFKLISQTDLSALTPK
ncbi:MAG: hypothetical protein JNL06_03315 [Alphaproteobacteria bacterium]|nr:hypothetical protein [Alphaproteobacteria bacterium]